MFPLDLEMMRFIQSWHAPWLDQVMIFLSRKWVWLPLYLLIAGTMIYRYKWQGLISVFLVALVVLLADQITSSILKPWVGQLRPCQNPDLEWVRNIHRCGGKYGFASGHAANTMGLAVYCIALFRHPVTFGLLLWSLLVGISRVYLGVHFPFDVLVGWLVGALSALLVISTYRKLSRSNKLFL